MAAQNIKTVELPKHHYKDYLRKAEEFFNVMHTCLDDERWDAAVLNGVHSSISITDALLVNKAGIRSISQRHDDTVELLKQYIPKDELAGQHSRLSKILNFKGRVSYQPIIMDEAKAREFAKGVERYFEWAKKMLP